MPDRDTPSFGARELTLTANDGLRLGAICYEPRVPRATVVINGATAVPQAYYRRFAEHLAGEGFRVLTYDYRGIGRSRPQSLAGFDATMTDWARRDAMAALAYARTHYRYDPVVLVGHSFGAQLVGLIDEAAEATAAVFFGGQFGYYGHWELPMRLRLGLLWYVGVPTLTSIYGYFPGRFGTGEDLPLGVAREWAAWCTSPGYLADAHPDARARFARFDVPTLSFGATDDLFAPPSAIGQLIDALPGGKVVHRQLRPRQLGTGGIGHFGFFRSELSDPVWTDTVRFIGDVLDGHPTPRTGAVPAPEPSDPGSGLSAADVMSDLAYGR